MHVFLHHDNSGGGGTKQTSFFDLDVNGAHFKNKMASVRSYFDSAAATERTSERIG